MIKNEFRFLFNTLSDEEIIDLHLLDPYFLDIFCYMLTLEVQTERENHEKMDS
tara:strand:+ start:164 stop:322 length:159 start_codon:yes stop_codon:yes gene_type:complete